MTGALEEFLRRKRPPQFWEICHYPTIEQIRAYNAEFDRKFPGIDELFKKGLPITLACYPRQTPFPIDPGLKTNHVN